MTVHSRSSTLLQPEQRARCGVAAAAAAWSLRIMKVYRLLGGGIHQTRKERTNTEHWSAEQRDRDTNKLQNIQIEGSI
jgi:hypothetical protein